MWYIHIIECYSALKRNKVLIYATAHMNLDNILSERIQLTKLYMYYMIPFI